MTKRELIESLADGTRTTAEIAKKAKCTVSYVNQLMKAYDLSCVPSGKGPRPYRKNISDWALTLWTRRCETTLVMMWPSHSASEIADVLNRHMGMKFTRNAVIGKAHRLGLSKGTYAFSTDERTRIKDQIIGEIYDARNKAKAAIGTGTRASA